MARVALFALLLLALAASAYGFADTCAVYNSDKSACITIQNKTMTVAITGVNSCTTDLGPNNPCYSIYMAGANPTVDPSTGVVPIVGSLIPPGDYINVVFTANSLAPATSAWYIVKLCYAKSSVVNRKWRKANTLIAKDNSCPWIMSKGAYPASGTFTINYQVPDIVPTATYYVKVLIQDAAKSTYVGWGSSAQYFTVQGINPVTTPMKIAVGVMSFVACAIPSTYAAVSWLTKKNK